VGTNQCLDQPELVIGPGLLFPEFRIFHKALLEVFQSRHGVTCFMRSRAVAITLQLYSLVFS